MASHLDALRGGPDYLAGEAEFRPPDGSGVVLYRTVLPAGVYRRPAAEDLAIQVQLTSGAFTHIDHGVRFACTTRAGYLSLAPRGIDVRYDMAAPASFAGAVLPAALLRAATADADGGRPLEFGWLHGASFADEAVAALLRRMWSEASGPAPPPRLLTDSVWTTVALLLHGRVRSPGGSARPPVFRAGPDRPADWRVRRTLDHIEGRLADDLGLDVLAAEVGLSRRQYTAMFRAATGVSPHAWVTARRVERACQLLRTTRRSITEVAHECGFSSPQHLATVFRKHRQVTPAAFRRDAR